MIAVTAGTNPLQTTMQEGRLDAHIATQFKDQMRDIAASAGGDVVLDMSAVQFMDSSGLGALIAVFKQMPKGHRLMLARPGENVMRVLKLTRMDTIFTILDGDANV